MEKKLCTFGVLIFLLIAFFPVSGLWAAERSRISLRLLIWEGYAPASAQDRFVRYVKKKYGVDLSFEISYASNPNAFFDALRREEVDLISPAHNLISDVRYNLTGNGLTLPINISHIPNAGQIVPQLLKSPWGREGEQVYGIPVAQGPYGLAYNVEKVREIPKSWNVLWDPEYHGLYVVHRDYYELNVYLAALAGGKTPEQIFKYDAVKGPELEKRLQSLAVNAGAFWSGFDKPEDFRNMALATTWRCVFPVGDPRFENWRIAVPREGTPWWVDVMMLSHTLKENPLKKRIAEEWINLLLEPSVQVQEISTHLGAYPVTVPALEKFHVNYNDSSGPKPLLNNLIPWKTLETRDRNAFNLLWQEAISHRDTGRRPGL